MALTPSPTSLTFASIAHNTTASQNVTLTSDVSGDAVFGVVITGANANQFSTNEVLSKSNALYSDYVKTSTVVKTGDADATFAVTYAPTVAGSHVANLELHYNGIGQAYVLTIPLSGSAT